MGNKIQVIDASSIGLGQFSSTSANTHATMVSDRAYQAVFQRKSYDVTYSPYPATGGSISFNSYDGNSSVEHETTITATATPDKGYVFVYWSGTDLTGSQQVMATLSLSITSNLNVQANFAKDGYVKLALTVSPEGAGSASGSGTYTYSPAVPISAKANDGYVFVGWQGGDDYLADLNSSTTTVSLTDDLTLTALFEYVPEEATEPKANQLDAVYNGWDWWYSDWFDFYWYVSGTNWLFHHQLGWCYMVIQNDESVWIWVEFMNDWVWTNQSLYPFIFDYQYSEWIWYNRDISNHGTGKRIFYRYSTEEWEEH